MRGVKEWIETWCSFPEFGGECASAKRALSCKVKMRCMIICASFSEPKIIPIPRSCPQWFQIIKKCRQVRCQTGIYHICAGLRHTKKYIALKTYGNRRSRVPSRCDTEDVEERCLICQMLLFGLLCHTASLLVASIYACTVLLGREWELEISIHIDISCVRVLFWNSLTNILSRIIIARRSVSDLHLDRDIICFGSVTQCSARSMTSTSCCSDFSFRKSLFHPSCSCEGVHWCCPVLCDFSSRLLRSGFSTPGL